MDDGVINLNHLEIPHDIDQLGGFEFDNLLEELAADVEEEQNPAPKILDETRASLAEAKKYAEKTCNLIKSGLDDGSVKSTASLLACQAEIFIATQALENATSNLGQAENNRRTRSKLPNRIPTAAAWRRSYDKLFLAENDQAEVVVPRRIRSKGNRTPTDREWIKASKNLES